MITTLDSVHHPDPKHRPPQIRHVAYLRVHIVENVDPVGCGAVVPCESNGDDEKEAGYMPDVMKDTASIHGISLPDVMQGTDLSEIKESNMSTRHISLPDVMQGKALSEIKESNMSASPSHREDIENDGIYVNIVLRPRPEFRENELFSPFIPFLKPKEERHEHSESGIECGFSSGAYIDGSNPSDFFRIPTLVRTSPVVTSQISLNPEESEVFPDDVVSSSGISSLVVPVPPIRRHHKSTGDYKIPSKDINES